MMPNIHAEQQEVEDSKKRRSLEIQEKIARRRRAIENIYKSSEIDSYESTRSERLAHIENTITNEISELQAQLVEMDKVV